MKKRMVAILLTTVAVLSVTACAKSGSEKKVSKDTEPEKLFHEAMTAYEKEDMKAVQIQYIQYYDNETQEEEFYTSILDSKNNIIERYSEDDGENSFHNFNLKEKDGYGVYVNDSLTGGEWKYYKEDLEDGDESEYNYRMSEFDFDFTKENGYSNMQYTNEGEEDLDGKKAIKIKVLADQAYSTGEISDGEITRESIMEDYDWTEEEVSLVDGFSKILDDYVKASVESEKDTTIKSALTVWINAEDHKLMKTRTAQKLDSALDKNTKKAIEKFNQDSWKVSMIHQSMEDGMSAKEAQKALEEDLAMMEEPQEESKGEASGEPVGEDDADGAEIVKTVMTRKIMSGKDCPKMGSLPEKYEKITQDEYFSSEFEDYNYTEDYFQDNEEDFLDEFEE